jgi:ribosomal protein S18 acetylase RimI-like enzyme
MDKITIKFRQPTVDEYSYLRELVGWGVPEKKAAEVSFRQSLFSVCLEREGEVIGLGRVVGDGGLYFYVQDIIVIPECRGNGYSRIIMDEVMKFIRVNAKRGSFVGLFASKGVEGLYEKYGFVIRPNETFGAGMFYPIE